MIRYGFSPFGLGLGARSGGGSAPAPGANDIVLIMAGQSNQAADGTIGQTPDSSYTDLASNPNVRIFNANIAASPGTWEAYDITVNSHPWQTTTPQKWAAEAEFCVRWLAKHPDARIDIIKAASGGSQLYDDTSANSWNSRATVASVQLYPAFVTVYNAAVAAGLAVREGHRKVFSYRQGERDSQFTAPTAAYETNLINLMADSKADFDWDVFIDHQLFSSASNPTLAVTYVNCDAIRTAQANAVAATPGAILIDDTQFWEGEGGNIHPGPAKIALAAARMYACFELPEVTSAGSITGTAQVGQTLTYTPAVWNYTPDSVAYQWKADGVAVSGATSLTFVPTEDEEGAVMTVTETATARLGSVSTTCTGTSAVAAAPPEDAATTALINAAVAAGGTAPNSTRRAQIDALIAGLKSDGIWTKLYALEILAGHDETFALMDWKDATKKAAIFAGSPTFVADSGYTLNGTNQSLTTGLNPTTLGIPQNQVGWGLWIAAGTGTTHAAGISGSAANRFGFNKAAAGSITGACSGASSTLRGSTGAPARAAHHYQQRNGSSTLNNYYVDGVPDTLSISQASASVQNAALLLGQNGTTPTWAADRYFATYFTTGDLTDTQIANLHSRLATYKSSIGA